MRRNATCAAALIVIAVVASACSSSSKGGSSGQVVLGAINALSGTGASAGKDTIEGAELAVDIINNDYPDIALPFAKGKGLPGLHGRTIKLVTQNTQGSPETAANAVSDLVSSNHAVGIVGEYASAATQSASERAERLGIPFVNGPSSAPSLTTRGLKTFFRVGPTDQTFGEAMFGLLKQQAATSGTISKIAILHTNDTYGNGVEQVTKSLAAQNGYQVVADISYDSTSTDLSPQVLRLREANPDVLFDSSYTSDAILLVKAMRQFHFAPKAVLGYGAGFSDPTFVPTLGSMAAGLMSRAAWSDEIPNAASQAVAKLFQQKYGRPMTENSARNFTAMMTLATAINNAGSTDPKKIITALQNVNIPAKDLIMPWSGVKFDQNHQNSEAAGIVQQVQGGTYQVVYPADHAVAKVQWPFGSAQG
jgi:branched-chain amino acid transport system substrate-binding protein